MTQLSISRKKTMFLDPEKVSDFVDLGTSGSGVHTVKRVRLESSSGKGAAQAEEGVAHESISVKGAPHAEEGTRHVNRALPKSASETPYFYLKVEHVFDGDDSNKRTLRILNELFCSAIAAQVVKNVNRSRCRMGNDGVSLLIPKMGLVLSDDGTTLIGLYSTEISNFSPLTDCGRSTQQVSKLINLGIGINHALGYVLQDPDRNESNSGVCNQNSQTGEFNFDTIVGIDFGLAFYLLLREKDALTTEEEGKILASHSTKKGDAKDHELSLIRSVYSLKLDCLVKNKDKESDSIGLFKELGLGFYLALPTILGDSWLRVIEGDADLKSRLYADLYSVFVVFPYVKTVKNLLEVHFKKRGFIKLGLESSDQCIKPTLDLVFRHADARVKEVNNMITSFALSDAKNKLIFESPRGINDLSESELVAVHGAGKDTDAELVRESVMRKSPVTQSAVNSCRAKALAKMLSEEKNSSNKEGAASIVSFWQMPPRGEVGQVVVTRPGNKG